MKKAFSQITIKGLDEGAGVIYGIATTPSTDRAGDIVEPMGAEFSLPLPLLNGHDAKDPVGEVFEAKATPAGIEFSARIAKDVSDAIGEVWRRTKAGLFKHVSIGFRAIEFEPIATGYRFKKWAWLELSLTPTPANPEAAIVAVKSANHMEIHSMTVSEQIATFVAKRAELIGKMDTLVLKGATLQGQDDVDFKAHEAELAEVDKHLDRLKAIEARQATTAAPVQATAAPVKSVQVEENTPKGTDFVRFVKAAALSRGNIVQAVEIAKSHNYGPRVETVLKAAVAAGTTDAVAYSSLVEHTTMTSEFIELLTPATIVGRLPSLRRVPVNVRIPKQTGATSAQWVGEAKPAPMTGAAYSDMTVDTHKVSALVALSEDLMRTSDPKAETLIRADLIRAAAQAVDVAFADVANAGIAGIKPASVFNGTANTALASGTSAAAVRVDVAKVFGYALAANQPLDGAVWLMHPATCLQLSMMRHATSGQQEFPGITMEGGTFFGLPVVASTNVPGSAGAGYAVSLIVQPEILLAEDGISIDASREASLEFDSAPTQDGKTPTAAPLVNLWQNGLVAVKVSRPITWKPRRPSAVAQITACKYAA